MTGGTAGPLEEWDDRGQHLAPLPKRDIHFCQREELRLFLTVPALWALSQLC